MLFLKIAKRFHMYWTDTVYRVIFLVTFLWISLLNFFLYLYLFLCIFISYFRRWCFINFNVEGFPLTWEICLLKFDFSPHLGQKLSNFYYIYLLSFWKEGWLNIFLVGYLRDLWNPYMLSCLTKLFTFRCRKYFGKITD